MALFAYTVSGKNYVGMGILTVEGVINVTPIQEAYALMQQQPESNIKIIVELLQKMLPAPKEENVKPFRRTGVAKGLVQFPKDFDEHFDDLNSEIGEMFNGGIA